MLAPLAVAAVAPMVTGEFWTRLILQALIFGLPALLVDLLLGHAGLFSLCHASFFAVAAFTVAILEVRHGFPTLLAVPAAPAATATRSFAAGGAPRSAQARASPARSAGSA